MSNLKKALITGAAVAASTVLWVLFLKEKKKKDEIDKDFDVIFDYEEEHTAETYQKPEDKAPSESENENIYEENLFEDIDDFE